jgi:hypothetical protein
MSVEWSSLYICHGWVWNDLPCTFVMDECGMIFPVHFSWMSVESSSLYFYVVLIPYCKCQWSKILLTFFVKEKWDILKSRSQHDKCTEKIIPHSSMTNVQGRSFHTHLWQVYREDHSTPINDKCIGKIIPHSSMTSVQGRSFHTHQWQVYREDHSTLIYDKCIGKIILHSFMTGVQGRSFHTHL